jgi:hypothetical protein
MIFVLLLLLMFWRISRLKCTFDNKVGIGILVTGMMLMTTSVVMFWLSCIADTRYQQYREISFISLREEMHGGAIIYHYYTKSPNGFQAKSVNNTTTNVEINEQGDKPSIMFYKAEPVSKYLWLWTFVPPESVQKEYVIFNVSTTSMYKRYKLGAE